MLAIERPSREDSMRVAGVDEDTSWRLQEIGLYTVGEVLDASDAHLRTARWIGPIRAAALRRRMREHLARPVEEEEAPPPIRPAPRELLGRPVIGTLVAFAHAQDDRVRLVLMRDLGSEPDDRMTWNAMARRLDISLPTLARSRRRARDSLREDPVGMLLRERIHELRRRNGPRLGEALRGEPWARGMSDQGLAMLARMLVGVDIDRGAIPVFA